MRSRSWVLAAALAVLLIVALVATNPDRQAFATTYADRLARDVPAASGPFGQLLGGLTQNALDAALSAQVRRTDYLVASVYTVPMAGPDLRALGVLGHFITLQQPSMR